MVDLKAPFGHNFFQIPVTQGITQIPPHTEQNNFGLMMPPFEGVKRIQIGSSLSIGKKRE
jgi:hypothetical protein